MPACFSVQIGSGVFFNLHTLRNVKLRPKVIDLNLDYYYYIYYEPTPKLRLQQARSCICVFCTKYKKTNWILHILVPQCLQPTQKEFRAVCNSV